MRVKTISVEYERKFDLADFNSMKVGAGAWADLGEGEDPEAAYNELFATVKAVVREQGLPVLRQRQARVEEVFAGIPIKPGNGHREDHREAVVQTKEKEQD